MIIWHFPCFPASSYSSSSTLATSDPPGPPSRPSFVYPIADLSGTGTLTRCVANSNNLPTALNRSDLRPVTVSLPIKSMLFDMSNWLNKELRRYSIQYSELNSSVLMPRNALSLNISSGLYAPQCRNIASSRAVLPTLFVPAIRLTSARSSSSNS